MSAYMPHPMQPHDPDLDRALAMARTPQVPESLAARIARDVTRLPQDPQPIRAVETPAAAAPRKAPGWLRVAGFAALTLLTGAAAASFLLQNGSDDDQPAQQLAAIDQPSLAAPAPAHKTPQPALTRTGLAQSPAADDTRPALKPIAPPSKSPAAQQAPVELASETAPPTPITSKPGATAVNSMAENGPFDTPQPTGTLAPTTSVYGPPAGLGISNGGGGMAMPENSGQSTMPRGGTPSGMPGGGMPGGGMGGPGGGPGGGMHPRH